MKYAVTDPVASGGSSNSWSRPLDWLPKPALVNGDAKIVLLVAIYQHDSNFIAFRANGGNYTVDWGDGSATQDFSAGAQAQKNIAWADVSASTLTSEGFRQVYVTITAQSGQTITSADLSQIYSGAISTVHSATIGAYVAGAALDRINFSGSAISSSLKEFEFIGDCNVTSCLQMFNNCAALRSVNLFDTSNSTSFNQMFNNCYTITEAPAFDLSSAFSCYAMFLGCESLRETPAFDMTTITNMQQMFYNCKSLEKINLTNTQNVETFAQSFQNAYALGDVSPLDFSSATNLYSTFNGCYTLKKFPDALSGVLTTTRLLFNNCSSLQEVGNIDMTGNTTVLDMFTNCFTLGSCAITNTGATISYANGKLSPAQIEAICAALATVTGQTITFTGNWGAATADTSAATSKGWTVVV